jgi:hypothetical protein
MTFQAVIARPLMAFAAAVTPASRAEWSQAMGQEFEALQDGPGSLGWATGCLANALGWRMKAETPFGLALVGVIIAGWLLAILIFNLMVDWFYPDWIRPMSMASTALQATAAFGLAVMWPRRTALAGLTVPLAWDLGAMPRFFLLVLPDALANPWASEGNHPAVPSILFPLMFLAQEMWASLLGAALGWGVSRLWRARRATAAA